MKYVVVDVGCLECQNLSEIQGIYDSLEQAQKAYPQAKMIYGQNDVRYAEGQLQILTFPPTATE